MKSLALSEMWDLTLDGYGNMAAVEGTPRIVQDVASYERTFQGEPYYAQQDGIPYLLDELASLPPAELVRERANRRALEVPGVAAVSTSLDKLERRTLHGTLSITTETGESANVSI